MNRPSSFYLRLVAVFVAIVALVLIGRALMLPDSWGKYGYYRGNYIGEEASKSLTYGTNESCKECHAPVYELKASGTHKRLSCEICHGPVGVHAQDGKKIADMPVKGENLQKDLCLTCHQKVVGRPEKFPMITFPDHLEDQKVKPTHTCNQCHTVHAPLENMKHVKELRTLKDEMAKEKKEMENDKN